MKKSWYRIICLIVLSLISFRSEAVIAVQTPQQDSIQPTTHSDRQNEGFQFINQKLNHKTSKIRKRIQRITKRFFKKNNSFGNVLAARKFRLGALLFLVGLIGAIVINIFSLAQIFGWLSGAIALAGLVLMIWSLIEHS